MTSSIFIDRRKSYVQVLQDVYKIPLEYRKEYLDNKYSDDPIFLQTILDVLRINEFESEFPVSAVVEKSAESVIESISPDSYLGKKFGSWTANEILKTTQKSIVLKGTPTNKAYSQEVAIKVIFPTYGLVFGEKHGAKQAHYMHKCKHENVVEEKIAGVTGDGVCFIVMEFLSGMDIVSHCEKYNLTLLDRLKLFIQVCSGVSAMHIRTVVHSDLKPGNILMNTNDSIAVPKIIDMDLSLSTDAHFHESYDYKIVNGHTLLYAAPEQLDGDFPTTLSDIYSLSIILFEMLTGIHPSRTEKSLQNLINSKYAVSPRHIEIASIYEKMGNKNPANRFQSVEAFINEINIYIEGQSIVPSYFKKANFFYKTNNVIKQNKLFFSFTLILLFVILGASASVISERNEAKKSLHLLVSSYDPRALESKRKFNEKATNALNDSGLMKKDYYDILIGYGDAFYGKGEANKAVNFFKKAIDLFTDKYSIERIDATTKLVLAYYSLAEVSSAVALLTPYFIDIFGTDITNPSLFQLLLAAAELDHKFGDRLDLFGDYDVTNVLSKIDPDKLNDLNLNGLTKLHLLLNSAVDDYYSISSDYSSVLSYKSNAELKSDIYPKLKDIKEKMENALSIIRNENIVIHLEPMIYLWLGYIFSELGELGEAETYSQLGIDRTILIFGIDHPRTVEAYIKRFGSFKYSKPEKAFIAAKKAYEINKTNSRRGGLYLFPYQIFIKANLLKGDFVEVERVFYELMKEYESVAKVNRSKIGASIMAATIIDITVFTLMNDDNLEYRKWQIHFEENYALYAPLSAEIDLAKLGVLNHSAEVKHYNLVTNYVLKMEADYSFQQLEDDLILTTYTILAELCNDNSLCDASSLVDKAERKLVWQNDIDNNTSIEKLIQQLKIAKVQCDIGNTLRGHKALNGVENILHNISYPGSYYVGYWNSIKAECYSIEGNIKARSKFAQISLESLKVNFGIDSALYKKMILFSKYIKN